MIADCGIFGIERSAQTSLVSARRLASDLSVKRIDNDPSILG